MFGGNRKKREENSLAAAMTPENAPTKGGGGGSVTGFDPEGLERAAKAARELDASRNAASAIELIKTQEATKQVRLGHLVLLSYKLVCNPVNLFSLCHTFPAYVLKPFDFSMTCCIMHHPVRNDRNSMRQQPSAPKWTPMHSRCAAKTLRRKLKRRARRWIRRLSTSAIVPNIRTSWNGSVKSICSRLRSTCRSE